MGLAEPFGTQEPTHQLVVRERDAIDDADPAGCLAVENRVINVAMRHGTAIHLCIDDTLNADRLAHLRETLSGVEDARVLENATPEYRAELPADADIVTTALSLPESDTAVWLDRLFGLAELAVVTDDSWLYRSVPHETHIREINAEAVEAYLGTLHRELSDIPGTAIVPHGPLASWNTDGCRYELTWDALRERRDEDQWRSISLERLRRVKPEPERSEIVFQWDPPTGGSRVVRGLRRTFGREVDISPMRLTIATAEVATVLDALEDLNVRLGYGYEIIE